MGAFSEIYKLAKKEREGGNKDKYEAYMLCLAIMEEESQERGAFTKKVEEEERAAETLELAQALVKLYEKLNNNSN